MSRELDNIEKFVGKIEDLLADMYSEAEDLKQESYDLGFNEGRNQGYEEGQNDRN